LDTDLFVVEANLNASAIDIFWFDASLAFADIGLRPSEVKVDK